MSRRRVADKREILPDPKYDNQVLAKFINILMRSGKKSTAERIVYGALDEMGNRNKADPVDLFTRALDNVKPVVEVRSRRVGGATYQIPVEVRQPFEGLETRLIRAVLSSPPVRKQNDVQDHVVEVRIGVVSVLLPILLVEMNFNIAVHPALVQLQNRIPEIRESFYAVTPSRRFPNPLVEELMKGVR